MLMATSNSSFDFDDLETDLNSITTKPAAAPIVYTEVCWKCAGSGIYRAPSCHGTQCFACKGAGKLTFKTSKAQRENNKAKAAARKQSKAESEMAKFEEANPDIAAWWTNSTFDFAISLRSAVLKYGDLTENQLIAAKRCVEKFNAAKEARKVVIAEAQTVNIANIELALKRAQANSIKRPKLRLAIGECAFIFSLAPSTGSNAGSVYVTARDDSEEDGSLYLGKITDGKFIKSRDCNEPTEASIVAACVDPLQSAVAYGRRFGNCSCCGRELTNGESIDLGIGPICRAKFF